MRAILLLKAKRFLSSHHTSTKRRKKFTTITKTTAAPIMDRKRSTKQGKSKSGVPSSEIGHNSLDSLDKKFNSSFASDTSSDQKLQSSIESMSLENDNSKREKGDSELDFLTKSPGSHNQRWKNKKLWKTPRRKILSSSNKKVLDDEEIEAQNRRSAIQNALRDF